MKSNRYPASNASQASKQEDIVEIELSPPLFELVAHRCPEPLEFHHHVALDLERGIPGGVGVLDGTGQRHIFAVELF